MTGQIKYLPVVFDDGGREEAGYKGQVGDCVCRSVAIITGKPYKEVYDLINQFSAEERSRKGRSRSSARSGVYKKTLQKLMNHFGFVWVPTMEFGRGTTVHLRPEELPSGRLVVKVSKHVTAVIDHQIYDTHDPQRGGMRAVYGYWVQPGNNHA